jgi:hypothetical protein
MLGSLKTSNAKLVRLQRKFSKLATQTSKLEKEINQACNAKIASYQRKAS